MVLRLEVPVVYAMELGEYMLVAEDSGETGVVVLVVMVVV